MKMKKLLTVLLLICLIVSVLPVTAFANTGTEDTNEEQYSVPLEDSTEQSVDNYISLYEYKSHYLPDEMIEVSFLLTSELEIEDIDDGGEDCNFKITYALNTGESVYLRVRGYGWNRTGEFTL